MAAAAEVVGGLGVVVVVGGGRVQPSRVCALQGEGLLELTPQALAAGQTLFKVVIQSATQDAKSFSRRDLFKAPLFPPRLFP